MSKKLFALLVAMTFLFVGGYSFADNAPGSENAIWVGGTGGGTGATPPVEYIRVRYMTNAAADAGPTSGDVLVWSQNTPDGVTVSVCVVDRAASYAGVALANFGTSDAINGYTWGPMAVRGYCLAHVDTSQASTMGNLVPAGATLAGYFGTEGDMAITTGRASKDNGILLRDDGSDGLMPVYLN